MGTVGRSVRRVVDAVGVLILTVYGVLLGFTIVNFFLFLAHCLYLGGDALNGHQTEGQFFVRSHGSVVEVPRQV